MSDKSNALVRSHVSDPRHECAPECPGYPDLVRRARTVRRIGAGSYDYRGRAIIRTSWDGPRGGQRWLWEVGHREDDGVPTVDGLETYRTLKAAKAAVDAELARR